MPRKTEQEKPKTTDKTAAEKEARVTADQEAATVDQDPVMAEATEAVMAGAESVN